MKSIVEGKIAGKSAYDIIDRKPKIDLEAPGSKKLQKDKI
jgi:hypothetical protein